MTGPSIFRPLRRHQKYRVIPISAFPALGNVENSLEANLGKSSLTGALAEIVLVETVMHVDFNAVKGAIFLLQIGNAEVTAGQQKVLEDVQNVVCVLDAPPLPL